MTFKNELEMFLKKHGMEHVRKGLRVSRCRSRQFFRPCRDSRFLTRSGPPINGWAIIDCPCGTSAEFDSSIPGGTGLDCPSAGAGSGCARLHIFLSLLVTVCSSQLLASSPSLPPLTTVSGSPRLPGKFVWADLVTDNVGVASGFYADLFGWTFHSSGDYVIMANADHPICGILQRSRPKDGSAKPHWFGYISTKNVAGAQRAVTRLGGRVLAAPQKFPDRGEQAVFADAEGAIFGVIKSSSGDPQDFKSDPGDWVWIQLLSHDASKASEFYRAVAGYQTVENTEINRLNDFVLVSEGYARATVRTIPKEHAQIKPDWLLYARISSITESVTRTRQLGGQVLFEPRPDYLQGRVAIIRDPTGAALGLLEWSDELLKRRQ